MSLKRKYTVTFTNPEGIQVNHHQEAECMKNIDCSVILMDWDEAGCSYKEVAFFRFDREDQVVITSVSVN